MVFPFLKFLIPKQDRSPRQDRSPNPETNSYEKKRDYEILSEFIGTGGSGHVVKARWKKRGSMVVALKVIRKASIKDRREYWKILNV
jgi:serine/threonine protein kinase